MKNAPQSPTQEAIRESRQRVELLGNEELRCHLALHTSAPQSSGTTHSGRSVQQFLLYRTRVGITLFSLLSC
jgi:hypothetical protein